MPLSLSPRVMNQNTSPGVTEASFPSTSDGTLPVPFPVFPWHDRQLRAYSFFPACAASSWPAYGFFAARAEAGALWNFVSTSAASSATGSRIAARARACESSLHGHEAMQSRVLTLVEGRVRPER